MTTMILARVINSIVLWSPWFSWFSEEFVTDIVRMHWRRQKILLIMSKIFIIFWENAVVTLVVMMEILAWIKSHTSGRLARLLPPHLRFPSDFIAAIVRSVLMALSFFDFSYGVVGFLNYFITKFTDILVLLQIVLTNPDMIHHGILPHHKVSPSI